MAFVTLENIEHLIPKAAFEKLRDPNKFAYYENLASKVIRDEAGIAIPTNIDTAPDWIIMPAAYIITKLVFSQVTGMTQETLKEVESNFQFALKTLRSHVSKGVATPISYSAVGQISGALAW